MLKERSQSFKILFVVSDFFASLFAFALAFAYRYYVQEQDDSLIKSISVQSYFYLGLAISITQILSFLSIDLYHPRRGLHFVEEFFAVLWGMIVNLAFVLSFLFFFRGESFSRLVIVYFLFFCIVLIGVSHFVLREILRAMRKRGYNLKKVFIIGSNTSALAFANNLRKHQIYGYDVIGFLSDQKKSKKNPEKILGNLSKISEMIQKYKPDMVVYSLGSAEGDHLKETIEVCDFEGIDLKVIPGYTEFITSKGRTEIIDGLPVISIRNIPIRLGYNRFLKRSFDILFSFSFLVIFSPIFLLIAILVKNTSPGPVFIRQTRIGLDNKTFEMLKFRSMFHQPKQASDTIWTKQNDSRVTWIGKYLRKTSLDEIPQFWNVLVGDMSVVGPRPERPHFAHQFREDLKNYMRRHAVKSGITGWAQIQGLRGDTSIEKRVEADIFYIENWSLLLDFKIILLTPIKGVFNRNAY